MKDVAVRTGLIASLTSVVISCGVAFAESPPAVANNSTSAFAVLVGKWMRTQGPYVISISAVDDKGTLDASYANPNSLPFHRAEATRDGNALKLYFELRAGGYGGSTYILNYDAASDSLRGVYDQVVVKQKFDVVFRRTK